MLGLKKRDIKKALKTGGSSYADVRANIEATIDEAMNSTDPEVQANFKKYFGNKRPTSEEYIYKITKKTKVKL
ncbi:MAG: hypothetical protein Q4C97_01585 [Bacillota bacterium]|nr:hypothetical protein [Bacillota bacterium]